MRPQSHPINALLNLLGGASMSIMVLWVPYWLNQSMGPNQYALWALAYQVITYIPLLGFGMNLILIRGVASAVANSNANAFTQILSNGFWLLMGLIGIALMLVITSGFWIDRLLPIASEERFVFQQLWWVLGGAGSIGLLSFYFFGVFGGHQQYLWENAYKTIFVSSFLLGLWLVLASEHLDLFLLACIYGGAVAIALLFLLAIYRFNRFPMPKWGLVHRSSLWSLMRAMGGLGVWNFSLVLVSGLDLWIVARIDFASVPGYALALSLMTFLMGVGSALFSPCLPVFANALAQTPRTQFDTLFRRYQRWLILIAIGIALVILLIPNTLWNFLFKESSTIFITVMPILLLATVMRFLTLLYAYALVGANRQHQIIASPLLEGILNVVFSILLSIWMGPIGVALGTLVGAMVCLVMATLYNIPKQKHWIPLCATDLVFPWKKD